MTIPPQFPDPEAEHDVEAPQTPRYTSTKRECVNCDGEIVGSDDDLEIEAPAGFVNGDGTLVVAKALNLDLADTIPGPHVISLQGSVDGVTWFFIAQGWDLESIAPTYVKVESISVSGQFVPYAEFGYVRVFYHVGISKVLITPTPDMTIISAIKGACATASAVSDVSQSDADAKASALALAQARSSVNCLGGENTNGAPVRFNNGTMVVGALYPSAKVVSGLGNSITKVTVSLVGVNHMAWEVVALLLVAPDGTAVLLYSVDNTNGQETVFISPTDIVLDDDAADEIPRIHNPPAGTYLPTVESGQDNPAFPSPAPAGPYETQLSAFNGKNPNGAWKLYPLHKQFYTVFGPERIVGGWDLTITT